MARTDRASPGETKDELVVVGRVGAPHGVKGYAKLHSFTQPADNLRSYAPWYLDDGTTGWRVADGFEIDRRNETFYVRFSGVADRDSAARMTGWLIGVPVTALPPVEPGEYYWRDLVGLAVVNEQGDALGRVAALIETGAHDVLVIADDGTPTGRERLIPFVSAYVQHVDLQAGVVTVTWPSDYDD